MSGEMALPSHTRGTPGTGSTSTVSQHIVTCDSEVPEYQHQPVVPRVPGVNTGYTGTQGMYHTGKHLLCLWKKVSK
eukprot:1351356-Rhodomonas_salina.1